MNNSPRAVGEMFDVGHVDAIYAGRQTTLKQPARQPGDVEEDFRRHGPLLPDPIDNVERIDHRADQIQELLQLRRLGVGDVQDVLVPHREVLRDEE